MVDSPNLHSINFVAPDRWMDPWICMLLHRNWHCLWRIRQIVKLWGSWKRNIPHDAVIEAKSKSPNVVFFWIVLFSEFCHFFAGFWFWMISSRLAIKKEMASTTAKRVCHTINLKLAVLWPWPLTMLILQRMVRRCGSSLPWRPWSAQ